MTKEIEVKISKNRTCVYLLPALGNSIHEFKNFVQAYVGDEEFPEEKNKLFVLYKVTREPWFNAYFQEIKNHVQYNRSYKVNDNYFMVVYDLTSSQIEFYDHFINGRYSLLEDSYKDHILNFHNLSLHSEVAKVLHRSEIKYQEWEKRIGIKIPRTQEIGSMPDLEEEMFNKHKVFKIEE